MLKLTGLLLWGALFFGSAPWFSMFRSRSFRYHLHVKIAGYCVAAEQKHASHITICVVALFSWRLVSANFSCAEHLSQPMTKTALPLTFYSICNRYSCLRKGNAQCRWHPSSAEIRASQSVISKIMLSWINAKTNRAPLTGGSVFCFPTYLPKEGAVSLQKVHL